MKILLILHDAPYASERSYNALRLAASLDDGNNTVRLFCIGDAAWTAVRGQTPPDSCSYNAEWLLQRFLAGGREALVCRTCMDARGIRDEDLIPGAARGSLDDLSLWTLAADRVLSF